MGNLDWRWVIGFAIVALLLYRATPVPIIIPSQAILNVEQDKSATVFISLVVPPPDTDLSDNNFTKHRGAYKIVTMNGSIIKDWQTTAITTNYEANIDYAPSVNSSIIAEIFEEAFNVTITCACTAPPNQTCVQVCTNTSVKTGEQSLVSQKVDIAVVPKQSQPAPVVATTSSGYYKPITSNTPVTPASNLTPPTQDILVPAQETFWSKYGLLMVLSISFIVLGFALLNYFGGGRFKGRRRR